MLPPIILHVKLELAPIISLTFELVSAVSTPPQQVADSVEHYADGFDYTPFPTTHSISEPQSKREGFVFYLMLNTPSRQA